MDSVSFLSKYSSSEITTVVVIFMILFYWLGHYITRRRQIHNESNEHDTTGVVQGSLLGLLALLLGFSFSLSNSRYDKRMGLVIDEGNAIGTAILRMDLYPDSIRMPLKLAMRDYLEARIAYDDAGADREKIIASLQTAALHQQTIWKMVSAAAQHPEHVVRTNQMVPALNEMFDLASTRQAMLMAKVPDLILYLLFILCFTGSFLIGYADNRKPEWGIVTSFLIMVGLSIYMILDLDRPRSGMINNKAMYEQISSLRSMFNNP